MFYYGWYFGIIKINNTRLVDRKLRGGEIKKA